MPAAPASGQAPAPAPAAGPRPATGPRTFTLKQRHARDVHPRGYRAQGVRRRSCSRPARSTNRAFGPGLGVAHRRHAPAGHGRALARSRSPREAAALGTTSTCAPGPVTTTISGDVRDGARCRACSRSSPTSCAIRCSTPPASSACGATRFARSTAPCTTPPTSRGSSGARSIFPGRALRPSLLVRGHAPDAAARATSATCSTTTTPRRARICT